MAVRTTQHEGGVWVLDYDGPKNKVPRYLPRRRKLFRPRHGPGLAKARVAGAVDQFTRAKRRIELRERPHLGDGCSLREMNRADLLRMFEPGGGEQFGQRMQRGVVVIVDPLDLVRHHQRAIT